MFGVYLCILFVTLGLAAAARCQYVGKYHFLTPMNSGFLPRPLSYVELFQALVLRIMFGYTILEYTGIRHCQDLQSGTTRQARPEDIFYLSLNHNRERKSQPDLASSYQISVILLTFTPLQQNRNPNCFSGLLSNCIKFPFQ